MYFLVYQGKHQDKNIIESKPQLIEAYSEREVAARFYNNCVVVACSLHSTKKEH